MEKPKVKLGEVIDIAAAAIAGSYLNNIPYQPIYMEGTTGIGKTQMIELDLPKMIDDIRNHSKTNKSSLSTIKRHFVEGKFIPPFDILKDNSDDDPYLKYLIWMTNLVEGNIYVFNLLLNFYLYQYYHH